MLIILFNAIMASCLNMFIFHKILKKPICFHSYKIYIGMIFMTIGLIINSVVVDTLLKTIIVLVITFLTVEIVFNVDKKEAMVLSIITQLLYIISEILVIIVVLVFTNMKDNQDLVNSFFGTIYANFSINIIVLIISQFKCLRSLYEKILTIISKQKVYNIFIIAFMIISMASIVFNFIYYRYNLVILSCVGLVLLAMFVFFIVKGMIIRYNYLNIHVKYNDTLETLKSYEDMLDKYRVSNHENKNQLLTIRNMIKNKEEDVASFIDKLVDNQYKDDDKLIMETSRIPNGGLKALIYSKCLYMKNNNINYSLEVDRKVRSVQIIAISEELMLNICKIIGVFLDNAIEETERIKRGSVLISIYLLDGKLNISISNIFEGFIDLERISEVKYTTKGNGHGYGLALVKEIIDKNNTLTNVHMITDDVFSQVLRINI